MRSTTTIAVVALSVSAAAPALAAPVHLQARGVVEEVLGFFGRNNTATATSTTSSAVSTTSIVGATTTIPNATTASTTTIPAASLSSTSSSIATPTATVTSTSANPTSTNTAPDDAALRAIVAAAMGGGSTPSSTTSSATATATVTTPVHRRRRRALQAREPIFEGAVAKVTEIFSGGKKNATVTATATETDETDETPPASPTSSKSTALKTGKGSEEKEDDAAVPSKKSKSSKNTSDDDSDDDDSDDDDDDETPAKKGKKSTSTATDEDKDEVTPPPKTKKVASTKKVETEDEPAEKRKRSLPAKRSLRRRTTRYMLRRTVAEALMEDFQLERRELGDFLKKVADLPTSVVGGILQHGGDACVAVGDAAKSAGKAIQGAGDDLTNQHIGSKRALETRTLADAIAEHLNLDRRDVGTTLEKIADIPTSVAGGVLQHGGDACVAVGGVAKSTGKAIQGAGDNITGEHIGSKRSFEFELNELD